MKVFGLQGSIYSGARSLSRCVDPGKEVRNRMELLKRWHQARRDGLNAACAAKAVGVGRATLYRWDRALARGVMHLKPRSCRPHRVRTPAWPVEWVEAVQALRQEYPMWGKAKLTVVLRRDGLPICESTTGRILKRLMDRGQVLPAATLRGQAPRAQRRRRPHAKRLPKGLRPTQPGEIVQLDTLTIQPAQGRRKLHQFTAYDPVSKWTCAQAFRRATADNAANFLNKLLTDMPFPVKAIQVDGGSEFKAKFEQHCAQQNITLYELPPRSPKINGHVERNNGAWRYEFYGCWKLNRDELPSINHWINAFQHEYNHFRPHQALAGKTPVEYLSQLTTEKPPPSQR